MQIKTLYENLDFLITSERLLNVQKAPLITLLRSRTSSLWENESLTDIKNSFASIFKLEVLPNWWTLLNYKTV